MVGLKDQIRKLTGDNESNIEKANTEIKKANDEINKANKEIKELSDYIESIDIPKASDITGILEG